MVAAVSTAVDSTLRDEAEPASHDADVAVRVRGLSKHYQIYDKPHQRLLHTLFRRRYGHPFAALEDVSFEVAVGETVGIIGRNGSGKSTLLQLVTGTLTPTEGDVQVHGRVAALLELGAGFNVEFTGRENVFVNAALMGLTRAEVAARLDRILAFADIGDFFDQPVKTYSSGMFVRLAFSVIAHVDADVLVIDEALAVGDAFFTQKCMRFLRGFREHGTILFVSHDSAAVVNLCDRAIWLDHGKVQAIGDAKTVSELYLKGGYESEQGASRTLSPAPAPEASVPPRLPATGGEPGARASGEAIDEQGDCSSPLGSGPGTRESPGEVGGALTEIALIERADVDTSFGKGGAVVVRVQLLDPAGEPVVAVMGGEQVCLVVEAEARHDVPAALVGFHVKDRLGQLVFGDNTYLRYRDSPRQVSAGKTFRGEFRFAMPHLVAGDYTVSAAVGEGTQDRHTIHHWIHDALAFRSQSAVMHGLFAVPTKKEIV